MSDDVKKNSIKGILIVVFVLLSIIVTVIGYSYEVMGNLEKQLNRNLEDVAKQNSLALQNRIHANELLIDSMAARLEEMPESNEDAIQYFDVFLKKYGLKRIAYCSPNGMTHSTDGVSMDLSFREFFKRGMAGKATITEILEDAMDEEHGLINIMTIPTYDNEGEISGVFGITYDSRDFNRVFDVECFDGEGINCILNEDGQIMVVAKNRNLMLSKNIFTDVLTADERNEEAARYLKENLDEKKSGSGVLYLPEPYYYYGIPVSLMNNDVHWYVLTLLPEKYLKNRAAPIQRDMFLMSMVVALCMLLGLLLGIFFTRKQRNTMRRLAYNDPITGGVNYAKFCVDMENRRIRQGYLLAMDITNFNNVNIVAGKEAGDDMLKQSWNILASSLQSDEMAGRVQSDQFAIFMLAPDDKSVVERMEKISERMNKLARLSQIWGIHARYGIYQMDGTENIKDAYEKAVISKNYARKKPEVRYAFYQETDHEQQLLDQQIVARFEKALSQKEFEVWYQPKYSAGAGEVVGSEALVRWREKDGNMISPGRFIPILEENGAIAKLDEYMFRAVCRQQEQWLKEGKIIYPVSINLSRASLYYADVVEKYFKITQSYHLDPQYVQLEVTESSVGEKGRISGFLEKFRDIGIRILMDDFGTGYSSLSTLNMKCFDTLKLDKSLIDHIGERDGETLLYHVINMGQQLGLHITAEGVETDKQLAYLKEMRCDDIQGFFFAKPMPASEFEKLLRTAE